MMRFLLVLLVGLISCAWQPLVRAVDELTKEVVHVVFTEVERKMIGEYYHPPEAVVCPHPPCEGVNENHAGESEKRGLPPGLAKKKRLPPGLQKQLERNGHLPPGLEKRALPTDLEARLPPVVLGCERVIVGTDVLLVETATGIIRDIIRNVLK